MTTFDKRKDAFENRFARDEELRFKATSRRNRMFGMWAAEKLGKSGDAAAAYALEVIRADMEEAGEEDVYRKVKKDFDAAGVDESEQEIRRMMVEFTGQAIAQVEAS